MHIRLPSPFPFYYHFFFVLFKALKWTEHHNAGTAALTAVVIVYLHTSQNKCGTATAHNHLTAREHAAPPPVLPYRLNAFRLIFSR